MSRIVFPALVAGCLSACAPPPNLASIEDSNNSNRNTGAVIGGLTGGLLAGPVAGGSGGVVAAGAVAGAAIGGAIGASLDRQAADLRRDLDTSISVDNQGDSLLVSFPQEILFDVNSATVQAGQRADLSALARNLQSYPDTNVEIVGHTDNTGTAAFNVDLSARRAGAVSAVLVDAGVAGSRVTSIGRGEDQPVASNLTEEGRAQNRRVDVVIRPTS